MTFPVDDLTLDMVESSLNYSLTYRDENGELLDEPIGVGAEVSLHSPLDFLSGTATDPLGVVRCADDGVFDDPRQHFSKEDVIRALIHEIRRLRSE